MSVSLFVDMGAITSHKVSCMCSHVDGETFEDYDDAALRLLTLQEKNVSLDGCDDEFCIAGGVFIEAIHDASDTAEINMSNRNAFDLFEYLGIDIEAEGWSGAFDARDLMARIDIALAVAPVSAPIPVISEGNMVMGGREEGYIQDRLSQVIAVCEDAIRLNRDVVWG